MTLYCDDVVDFIRLFSINVNFKTVWSDNLVKSRMLWGLIVTGVSTLITRHAYNCPWYFNSVTMSHNSERITNHNEQCTMKIINDVS